MLLERAIAATGYDLAILARGGGDRRLANLRKLMRLAREYERAEGRDLRGFLAYAVGQDLAEAREGEAALESEGLDAVRLMTIHRAKGLEFPVVCVADLGRTGATGRDRLLIGEDGGAGLRLATLAGGDPVPALGYERIAAALAAAEAAEERRLLYVAATRAEERLILSGGLDTAKWPAPRGGNPPLDWLAAGARGRAAFEFPRRGASSAAATAPSRVRLVTAENLPPEAAAPAPRGRTTAPGTALPAEPKVIPIPRAAPGPAPPLLLVAERVRQVRLPLLPDARARAAARRGAGRRDPRLGRADAPRRPRRAEPTSATAAAEAAEAGRRGRRGRRAGAARGAAARVARPPAAGAARLRAPGAADGRGRRGGRGRVGHRAASRRTSPTCATRSRRSPRPRCARGSPRRTACAGRPASPSRSRTTAAARC